MNQLQDLPQFPENIVEVLVTEGINLETANVIVEAANTIYQNNPNFEDVELIEKTNGLLSELNNTHIYNNLLGSLNNLSNQLHGTRFRYLITLVLTIFTYLFLSANIASAQTEDRADAYKRLITEFYNKRISKNELKAQIPLIPDNQITILENNSDISGINGLSLDEYVKVLLLLDPCGGNVGVRGVYHFGANKIIGLDAVCADSKTIESLREYPVSSQSLVTITDPNNGRIFSNNTLQILSFMAKQEAHRYARFPSSIVTFSDEEALANPKIILPVYNENGELLGPTRVVPTDIKLKTYAEFDKKVQEVFNNTEYGPCSLVRWENNYFTMTLPNFPATIHMCNITILSNGLIPGSYVYETTNKIFEQEGNRLGGKTLENDLISKRCGDVKQGEKLFHGPFRMIDQKGAETCIHADDDLASNYNVIFFEFDDEAEINTRRFQKALPFVLAGLGTVLGMGYMFYMYARKNNLELKNKKIMEHLNKNFDALQKIQTLDTLRHHENIQSIEEIISLRDKVLEMGELFDEANKRDDHFTTIVNYATKHQYDYYTTQGSEDVRARVTNLAAFSVRMYQNHGEGIVKVDSPYRKIVEGFFRRRAQMVRNQEISRDEFTNDLKTFFAQEFTQELKPILQHYFTDNLEPRIEMNEKPKIVFTIEDEKFEVDEISQIVDKLAEKVGDSGLAKRLSRGSIKEEIAVVLNSALFKDSGNFQEIDTILTGKEKRFVRVADESKGGERAIIVYNLDDGSTTRKVVVFAVDLTRGNRSVNILLKDPAQFMATDVMDQIDKSVINIANKQVADDKDRKLQTPEQTTNQILHILGKEFTEAERLRLESYLKLIENDSVLKTAIKYKLADQLTEGKYDAHRRKVSLGNGIEYIVEDDASNVHREFPRVIAAELIEYLSDRLPTNASEYRKGFTDMAKILIEHEDESTGYTRDESSAAKTWVVEDRFRLQAIKSVRNDNPEAAKYRICITKHWHN